MQCRLGLRRNMGPVEDDLRCERVSAAIIVSEHMGVLATQKLLPLGLSAKREVGNFWLTAG